MESSLITIVIAVVLIALAWKVLKGIVKTLALVVILAAVAFMVFGDGSMAGLLGSGGA